MPDNFRISLQTVYASDCNKPNQQAIAQSTTPIHQQKRFGFDDPVSQRRIVYRRSDFVSYRGPNIGRINQIFTRSSSKKGKVRLFVELIRAMPSQKPITPTIDPSIVEDPITRLTVYQIGPIPKKPLIVGLLALGSQKVWIVPIKRSNNASFRLGKRLLELVDSDKLVYVDWDVQQL